MAAICTACGVETARNASFCHACGAPLEDKQPSDGPPRGKLEGEASSERPIPSESRGKSRARDKDDEKVIWQGSFCWRAMIGSWIGAGLVTLIAPAAAAVSGFSGQGWLALGALLAALWIALGLRLAYRQISVHYYLTSQRFMHEKGLLWRQIDRIEAIDIDDVSYQQGPVDRMLGVGTVTIRSSDVSTPVFRLLGIDRVDEVASMIDEARRQERLRRGLYLETT